MLHPVDFSFAEMLVGTSYGINFNLFVATGEQSIEVYQAVPLPVACTGQYNVPTASLFVSPANTLPMLGTLGGYFLWSHVQLSYVRLSHAHRSVDAHVWRPGTDTLH